MIGWFDVILFLFSSFGLYYFSLKPPARNINFTNELIKTAKHLTNEVWGVESLALHSETNMIYGSSKDGYILEMQLDSNFKPEVIARYIYGLHEQQRQQRKRRPLGMRFSQQNTNELYFVDAYQGIFSFNIIDKKFTEIYTNHSMPYLNDFDFLQNGDLVLSQPSISHSDDYFHRVALENKPNGRLLHFDMKQKQFSILVDNLYTPNGVQVAEDGKTIYFAEMMAYQIKRFNAHEKPIKIETVIDRLPGMPDNIRFDNDGETLIIPFAEERLEFGIFNYPILKHYMLWIYENFILIHQQTTFTTFVLFLNVTDAQIIKAWNDPTGSAVNEITQVLPINEKVFMFGSDMAHALYLLKL